MKKSHSAWGVAFFIEFLRPDPIYQFHSQGLQQ